MTKAEFKHYLNDHYTPVKNTRGRLVPYGNWLYINDRLKFNYLFSEHIEAKV